MSTAEIYCSTPGAEPLPWPDAELRASKSELRCTLVRELITQSVQSADCTTIALSFSKLPGRPIEQPGSASSAEQFSACADENPTTRDAATKKNTLFNFFI